MFVVRMCIVAAVAAAVSVSSVQAQVGLPTPRPGLPNAAAAKETVKCGKAITKAAITFASAKLNLLKKCTDTVGTCLQLKSADLDGCLAKAKGTCKGLDDKIAGAKAKLTGEVDKKCINVAPSDLLAENHPRRFHPALSLGAPAEIASTSAPTACVRDVILRDRAATNN